MSILKSLKLAAASPTMQSATEFGFREKLLSYLNEQKALAEAEIGGTQYRPTRKVTQVNEAGEKIRVDAPRHIRKGWFTNSTGGMFFQLRYGSRPLELAKGMNAIEVDGLADVPAIIASIIEATRAGELDPQLKAARDARRANFKSRANEPKA
jgi:hypothetical protein